MNNVLKAAIAAGFLVCVSACSGPGVQQSIEPPVVNKVNPITQSTLQFAIGTANIAGVVGLDSIETLRQNVKPYLGTSVLQNAPSIVGPPGFVVPSAPDAYGDAGTNAITGTNPTSLVNSPPATTFDPSGGIASIASSFGFLPAANTNSSVVPNLIPAPLPYYAVENPALVAAVPTPAPGATPNPNAPPAEQYYYVGGPPAFVPAGHTSTQDGTFGGSGNLAPGAYPGFTLGFVDFQAVPKSGTYTLNVVIPTGINTTTGKESYGTKTATAGLTATTVLATWSTPPTFTPDGTGGGTIATNFAGGAGITQEYLEIVNVGTLDPTSGLQAGNSCQLSGVEPYYYTFQVTPGATSVTVPDNIGAAPPKTAQPQTFCSSAQNSALAGTAESGDGYIVYGFAVDWPLSSASFPTSDGQVTPPLTGPNGQADITTSIATTGNVP
jgi:hypothetical protein